MRLYNKGTPHTCLEEKRTSKKFRQYHLKDREAKALLDEASRRFGVDLEQLLKGKLEIEVVEAEQAEIFLVNGKPLLAKTNSDLHPTLLFEELYEVAPKAIVDMGAVPYICKGANIMAPGIRRFEGEFRKGDLVFVADEKHRKALVVGEAMLDRAEAEKAKTGIVIRSIHYVGDSIWNSIKALGAR